MHVFRGMAALCLGALALGCEEEGATVGVNMDASAPLDGSTNRPDGGDGGGAASACNSWTKPASDKCGGSHCLETLTQVKAGASGSSVCKKDEEFAAFCSLDAQNKTAACAQANALTGAEAVRTCTAQALPAFTSACVDCYVASANCAIQKCLSVCYMMSETVGCDQCRVSMGCISSFYQCAGYKNPLL